MAAEITHKSCLITTMRYRRLPESGGRPSRPPWAPLHVEGQGWAAIAANCAGGHEAQELICDEHEGGETPTMRRTAKLILSDARRIVTALCVLNPTDVAVGDDSGAVNLFRYREAQHEYKWIIRLCAPSEAPIRFLASHKGTLAICSDCSAHLYEKQARDARLLSHNTHNHRLTALTNGPNGVVIGDASGNISIHTRNPTPKCTTRPAVRYGAVRALAQGPDRLLAAGDDECVHVLPLAPNVDNIDAATNADAANETRTLRERADADGHSSFVCGVAERNGRILSAGLDGRLVLWGDDALGTVVLERPNESFWGLQWPDDDIVFVAACCEFGRSVLYRIRLHLPSAAVCNPAARR